MKGPNPLLGLALRVQRQIGPGSWRPSSCLSLGVRVVGSPGEDHIDTGPVGLAALTPGGAENPPTHPSPSPPATALVHLQPRLQPLLTPTRRGLTASGVSLAAHMASPTYVDTHTLPSPHPLQRSTPFRPCFVAKFLGAAHTPYLQLPPLGLFLYSILAFGTCRMQTAHRHVIEFLTPRP